MYDKDTNRMRGKNCFNTEVLVCFLGQCILGSTFFFNLSKYLSDIKPTKQSFQFSFQHAGFSIWLIN
mgnify:CR=1 FL=1